MIKAFLWLISRVMEQIKKFLFGSLILTVLIFAYSMINSYIKINFRDISCKTYYPIKQKYIKYSKNHSWGIEHLDSSWKILSSYKNNIEDGLSISFSKEYNSIIDANETYISITPIENGKQIGSSFSYFNNRLSSIHQKLLGQREGIEIQLYKNMMPSMILVYEKDKLIGEIWFWEDGTIREIEFDAKHKFKKNWKNIRYANGQKAYLEKEEKDLDYRVIYNPNGEVLLKFPMNNNLCKIKLYQQGEKVDIPLYIDMKEVIDIFKEEKLKQLPNPHQNNYR